MNQERVVKIQPSNRNPFRDRIEHEYQISKKSKIERMKNKDKGDGRSKFDGKQQARFL